MSTCIVTGGAGFLGSHMCDALLANGHRVICVDNLDTGSLQNIQHIDSTYFQFVMHDLTKPWFTDEDIDVVYHLASPASPIDYLRLPLHTLKVGSYGTHHMLGLAKIKRARFVLASTSEVYGDPQVHPQPEDYWGHVNPIGPRGVYDEAKRYAEALTMAYHTQQGVNTGIVRTFNSILADEQVLYDDGRELRRETATDLAARLLTRARTAVHVPRGSVGVALADRGQSRATEYPLDGFTVPAFDSTGSVVSAHTDAFIGHPTSQRCYEVRTRYGRSIRVTGDHSLFVEGRDGVPVEKPVKELEPGERIAVASRIEVPERDRRVVSMVEVWRWTERDPWDLCAEAPGLGELAWSKRQDLFGMLVSERRNNGPNWRNGAWTKIIRWRQKDRVPLPALWRIGERIPDDARVRPRAAGAPGSLPATIEITDEFLWFLGVWVAEGSWAESSKGGYISIRSGEDVVTRAADFVERHLGLRAVRVQPTPDRAPSMAVNSKLLLRLMEFLGFGHSKRGIPGWILGLPLSRLKWFIEGCREGDGFHSGKKLEEGKLHEFSTVNDDLKDDLVVAFARFGLLPSVGRYETTLKQRTGDRRYPFWRLSLANVSPWSPLEWDEGVQQQLNARRTGDLVWSVVKEIKEVPATGLVYDFSVPGYENFWAGTGVMAHNTYGSRMRPHDGRAIPTFLRQALQDKPLTVFGDGSQTRSFCYVDDQIRGYIAMANSDEHMPVNIGNPDEFTLLELAETLIEVLDSSSGVVYEALPTDDPQVRQPDITRARELLGWEPKINLRDGLRRTVDDAGVERLIGRSI